MTIGSRVRTRILPIMPRLLTLGRKYAWNNNRWENPPLLAETFYKYESQDQWYRKAEVTSDEVHRAYQLKANSARTYNVGGPFMSLKLMSAYDAKKFQGYGRHGEDFSAGEFFTGLGDRPTMYIGGFLPIWPSDSLLPSKYRNLWDTPNLLKTTGNPLIPSISSWGPEAWAKTAPRIQKASGFVALAEAGDLPRMLKTSSKDFATIWKSMGGDPISPRQAPKRVSDTFLNHQFGWVPFLSDMQSFYDAYQNTAEYMSRMSHGNDQWKVYRRTLLDNFSETKILEGTNWVLYPGSQAIQNQMCTGPMKWEIWEERSTLVTTSGRFKWYRSDFDLTNPEYNSLWNSMGRQMAMYGVRISPANVWRATPWSWLADWGLNIGRSLDRITEQIQDGVVAQYLYLMHHDVSKLVLKCTIPFKAGAVKLTFYRMIDCKQRKEANNPYGFDLSWDSLSPMRLAILAALGISRT